MYAAERVAFKCQSPSLREFRVDSTGCMMKSGTGEVSKCLYLLLVRKGLLVSEKRTEKLQFTRYCRFCQSWPKKLPLIPVPSAPKGKLSFAMAAYLFMYCKLDQ